MLTVDCILFPMLKDKRLYIGLGTVLATVCRYTKHYTIHNTYFTLFFSECKYNKRKLYGCIVIVTTFIFFLSSNDCVTIFFSENIFTFILNYSIYINVKMLMDYLMYKGKVVLFHFNYFSAFKDSKYALK